MRAYSSDLLVPRNVKAQALDDAKVPTVPCHQREALLDRGSRNEGIKDVQAVGFRVELQEFVRPFAR